MADGRWLMHTRPADHVIPSAIGDLWRVAPGLRVAGPACVAVCRVGADARCASLFKLLRGCQSIPTRLPIALPHNSVRRLPSALSMRA